MTPKHGSALVIALLGVVLWPTGGEAGVRIKDITEVEGAVSNQLFGVGLVVGLSGTGAKSASTRQMAIDLLAKLGVNNKLVGDGAGAAIYLSNNISTVFVTADLGPWQRRGSRMDITVSIADDASSLQGGQLILTPLNGVDGEVYVTAQGPVSVGGFKFKGEGASVQQNFPSTGRVVNGGLVVKEAPGKILCNGQLRLLLHDPDYVTAPAVAKAINQRWPYTAMTLDAGTVNVIVPGDRYSNLVDFVGEIGLLEVDPDTVARVVIDERTGTIVVGKEVKIDTVAIQHGNLNITTTENPQVSQPLPFSRGRTVEVPRTDLNVNQQHGGGLHVIKGTVTVAELARALNALGATPSDVIAIFQALKQMGALHAELVTM
jgi:flagellar P-ring protein precursor FlgI